MAVEYIDVGEITNLCRSFDKEIRVFDIDVAKMKTITRDVLVGWTGKGRNQFETQMRLMELRLQDISDVLYEIYEALVDAETGYIDQDEAVAKQYSAQHDK